MFVALGGRRGFSGGIDVAPNGSTTRPTGDGFFDPFEPFEIPGTGLQGQVCPPGTRCVGAGIDIPHLGSVCLGSCVERSAGGGDLPPMGGCPEGTVPRQRPDGSVVCVEEGLPETFANGEVPNGGAPPPQGNGACATAPACGTRHVTIQGRCGPMRVKQKWDKGRGKWIRARRDNPMNPKANRRSMNRLKAAHREATKIIDTLDSFSKPKKRRTRAKPAATAVVCK